MSWKLGLAVGVGATMGLAMAGGGARAQSTDVPIEEIVVTAKNRSERLQDVPLTVNVVTADTIEKATIKSVADLALYTPGFVYSAADRGQPRVSIRGLDPGTLNETKQGVSFFIDGVYVGGEVTSINLQDLEQVEVIKGPQAAAFGRSTYAGAINYITSIPTDNLVHGKARGEYWSADSYDLNAMVSFPIVADKLFASIAARQYELGGVGINQNNPNQDEGAQYSTNAAVNLLFRPWDGTQIKLRTTYDRDEDSTTPYYTLFSSDIPANQRLVSVVQSGVPAGSYALVGTFPKVDPSKLGAKTTAFPPVDGGRDRRRNFVSLIADQDLLDGHKLTYSGGYSKDYYRVNQDLSYRNFNDPTLLNPSNAATISTNQGRIEDFSQQIRFASPQDQPFRYLGGIYFFQEKFSNYDHRRAPTPTSSGQSRGAEEIENHAAFFNLGLDLPADFRLSFEGRYEREKQQLDVCTIPDCIANTYKISKWESHFLPRVTLDWKPIPDVLLYVLYSEGVKSGRFNNTSGSASFNQSSVYATELAGYVVPEQAKNYEGGFKATLFDGTLTVDGAGFAMDIENQQLLSFTYVNGQAVTSLANAGQSEIRGGELQITWRPLPELVLTGNASYAHQEYQTQSATATELTQIYGLNSPLATLKGKTSPRVPDWTAAATATYTIPVYNEWNLSLRGDVLYVGQRFADDANLAILEAYTKVNVRATVTDGQYEFALWARDLFDNSDTVQTASTAFGDLTQAAPRNGQKQSYYIVVPRGREVGFTLGYKFDEAGPTPTPMPASYSAPPTPAPQPAAAATRYLVFFDFDKSAITPEASRIIGNAAGVVKGGQAAQVSVTGHTDLSGSDAYNLALSKRRAQAVADQLIADGVPAKEIVLSYKGKREPLVPTADGVREPQNRRAEIVLQ